MANVSLVQPLASAQTTAAKASLVTAAYVTVAHPSATPKRIATSARSASTVAALMGQQLVLAQMTVEMD
jgi:hypothetical protein